MAAGRSAPPSDRKSGRTERLAAALRENLRRRKAQARGRHASSQAAGLRDLAKGGRARQGLTLRSDFRRNRPARVVVLQG